MEILKILLLILSKINIFLKIISFVFMDFYCSVNLNVINTGHTNIFWLFDLFKGLLKIKK